MSYSIKGEGASTRIKSRARSSSDQRKAKFVIFDTEFEFGLIIVINAKEGFGNYSILFFIGSSLSE